jgi:competence protein ComEA
MSNRPGIVVQATCALLLSAALAPLCRGQIHEPPSLLVRLWPLYRPARPAVQLLEPAPSQEPERRPLVAPYVPRKLDINSASFSEIQNLPGITSSMAARIFAGRPYRNLNDLRSDGIPLNVAQSLEGRIVFGP